MAVKWFAFLIFILAAGSLGMDRITDPAQVPRMTKEDLKAGMASAGLVLIDVRYGRDWTDSDRKIAGAVREEPAGFDSWKGKYPKGKTLVLYCA